MCGGTLTAYGQFDFGGNADLRHAWKPDIVRLAAQHLATNDVKQAGIYRGVVDGNGSFIFEGLVPGDYEMTLELIDESVPYIHEAVAIRGIASFQFTIDAESAGTDLDLGGVLLNELQR